MAPSAWRYYAEEIAQGREDYYARSAERPGRFVGRGAESLGVSGREADAVALERLFGHGTDPRDGTPLGRSFSPEDSRAVAGFALTFSPPKSVSALWALAEQQTADQVLAAHEAAVSTALAFVDEHASFTRRGHNGVVQVDTDGLIAASFVHRTSRAADPQLHTHLLVANKVRAADAKWLSLDGRELFETQKAAGMLYKAALRSELSTRLGVAWTPVDENGVAEVVGVPQALIEQWSARRHELKAVGDELIANREVELGRTLTPNERTECFQIAAYRTRTPKLDADTPTAELRARTGEPRQTRGVSVPNDGSGTSPTDLRARRTSPRRRSWRRSSSVSRSRARRGDAWKSSRRCHGSSARRPQRRSASARRFSHSGCSPVRRWSRSPVRSLRRRRCRCGGETAWRRSSGTARCAFRRGQRFGVKQRSSKMSTLVVTRMRPSSTS